MVRWGVEIDWGWRGGRGARLHVADHPEGRLSTCSVLGVGSGSGDPPPDKASQSDQQNLLRPYRKSHVTLSEEVRAEPMPKALSL